jgi:hypothetical protein
VHVPADACLAGPELTPAQVASLEVLGRRRVDARSTAADTPCPFLLRVSRSGAAPTEPAGWIAVASVMRPADRDETTLILRRRH